MFLLKIKQFLDEQQYDDAFKKTYIMDIIRQIIYINKTQNLKINADTFIQYIEKIIQCDSDNLKLLRTFLFYYYYSYIYRNKINHEFIEILINPEFSYPQYLEIIEGFQNDLPVEHVKIYAHKHFNSEQMKQIRLGLEQIKHDRLTLEHIILYSNPDFDWKVMYIVRNVYLLKQKQLINIEFDFKNLIDIIKNAKHLLPYYNTNFELDIFIQNTVIPNLYKYKVKKFFEQLQSKDKQENNNISTKLFKI